MTVIEIKMFITSNVHNNTGQKQWVWLCSDKKGIWALLFSAWVLSALVWSAPALAAETKKTWKVNLKDADIRAFISQVSDITGYSFVVDPRVKNAKVTVVSSTAMNAKEVYELFQSVLHVHGFAAIPSGDVIKLVPQATAKQDSIRINQNRNVKGEELVTRVIPVKNTPAIELVPILRPLIPQYGHLAGVASANALIISDHAHNVRRILEIINRLDSAESEELEVVQLNQAWVGDVVKLLESLEPVATGKKNARKNKGAARVTVVAEERTNRLIIKGEKSARARVRALIKELDQPSQYSGATKVLYLRHANAEKVAEILKNLVSERQGKPASKGSKQASQGVNIQADETLNALVIKAEPTDMGDLEEVVKQLDVRRAQVLIEAAIVEVTGDVSNALGIQWASLDKENGPVGGINFSSLGIGNDLNTVITALSGDGDASIGLADGITLAGGERSSDKSSGYGALLQALANASNTNLLSTPSIMTLDNEEAEIVVGQNVPFITGSTTNTNAGTTNPFQTISREDVGLSLKVVPQINDGDVVRLQVEQEVSNVVPTAEGIQSADLITNKRSIKTTILADDGETLVLGGLIQDDYTYQELKVPLLGDLPVLGMMFKSRTKKNVKRNLLVFLKPNIIREKEEARNMTEEKYSHLRTLQLEIDANGSILRAFRREKTRLPRDMSEIYDGKRTKR